MARFYKLISLFAIILLISCEEGREAGKLYGQWRMSGSDTKYISFSGSITSIKDLVEGEVFGNFQQHRRVARSRPPACWRQPFHTMLF